MPVNIIIVTLFRKAKLKHHGIVPTKQNHVAKQQYWRKVKIIESIELPINEEENMFTTKSKLDPNNEESDDRKKKSL